jgi:hypothetical protein
VERGSGYAKLDVDNMLDDLSELADWETDDTVAGRSAPHTSASTRAVRWVQGKSGGLRVMEKHQPNNAPRQEAPPRNGPKQTDNYHSNRPSVLGGARM